MLRSFLISFFFSFLLFSFCTRLTSLNEIRKSSTELTMSRTYGLHCHENNTEYLFDFFISYIVRTQLENIITSVLQPIIACICFITNGCFLVVIVKTPSMRTITNAYLGCLSISDVIYTAIHFIIRFTAWWLSPIEDDFAFLKQHGCIIYSFMISFTYFTSMILVTIVSFERYLAICKPLNHRRITGKKRTIKLILVTCAVAAVLAAPPTYTRSSFTYTCWERPKHLEYFPAVYGACQGHFVDVTIDRNLKLYAQVLPFSVCFVGKYFGNAPPTWYVISFYFMNTCIILL